MLSAVSTALLALAAAIGLWLYDGAEAGNPGASDKSVYAGLPRASSFSLRNRVHVLENDGFTIGYSEIRRNPLWVAYHARPIKRRRDYRRPEKFEVDTRTLIRVTPRDYSNSGYQRGHLAPSWLIAQLYGRDAQRQTFLMSNITPQKPNLNQKVWQRLEEIESDRFARWFDGVWVITGPLFDDHIRHLRSGVEVPDAFYRIYVDEDAVGPPRILAFVVPQTVRGDESLDQFVTTVDEIEARAGFDFLSALEDVQEEQLESAQADPKHWRLAEVSRLPARY
jgi:endonuclease G